MHKDNYIIENDVLIKIFDKSIRKFIVPNGVKVIGRDVFCNCHNLEEVVLPDGLMLIDFNCFSGCEKLKKIDIPEGVKEIGDFAFECCASLEEVVLPQGLISIGSSSFAECIKLRKINIPESVKKIGSFAFQDCGILNGISLPKKLEILGRNVFFWCSSLNKINIPKGIKTINYGMFDSCYRLTEIILPEGITTIYDKAFYYCDLLHKITIPKTVICIGTEVFKYSGINKIAILYNDYAHIVELINNSNLFKYGNQLNNKQVEVVFAGPKLSIIEKMKIKKLIKNELLKVSFKTIKEIQNNEVTQNKDTENNNVVDEEINNLIIKIQELCNKLPENSKNLIIKRLNKLKSNYEESLKKEKEELKPKATLIRSNSITLTTSIEGQARKNYIYNLQSILNSLSREKALISLLEEIDEYRKLVNSPSGSMSSNNSIEDVIKSLVFLSTRIDSKTSKEVIDKIDELLVKPNTEYNILINNLINNKPNLFIESTIDPKQQLHISLSNLLDETIKYEEKLRPYLALLNTLNSSNTHIRENNSSINSMIPQIRKLISTIQVENTKNKLNNSFNEICSIFIEKIKNEIAVKTDLNQDNYSKLEIELRKVLQPFLEQLNISATIDSDIKKEMSAKEYLNEILNIMINKLNNKEFKNIEIPMGFVKIKTVYSYLNDIYIRIINSNIIDIDRENIINELIGFIDKWKSELNDKSVDEVSSRILKEIAEMDYDLNTILGSDIMTK